MKKLWERNPFNFALGAAAVGFLFGLVVPVTRLESESIPAAVDAVRSSLMDSADNDSSAGNGSSASNGRAKEAVA